MTPVRFPRDLRSFATISNFFSGCRLRSGRFSLGRMSGLIPISTLSMRIIQVALAFSLVFAIRPASRLLRGTPLNTGFKLALVGATLGASWWMLTRWKAITFRGGMTEPGDFRAGLIFLLVVFESVRRGIGLILAGIIMVFLSYAFLLPCLPAVLNGCGYSVERKAIFLTTDTAGIYWIPIGAAATYTIVFTILGALLSRFGAGEFFFEISMPVRAGYGRRWPNRRFYSRH